MKVDILNALVERGEAEATEVAWALGLGYEAAAMALLRAYRGGLLTRTGVPGSEPFRYTLTDKGAQRLDYLRAAGHPERRAIPYTPTQGRGDHDMRIRKRYSGLYHCTVCSYEVTLTDEPSLKCPDCDQRLFEGELPDEDSYDDGAEG